MSVTKPCDQSESKESLLSIKEVYSASELPENESYTSCCQYVNTVRLSAYGNVSKSMCGKTTLYAKYIHEITLGVKDAHLIKGFHVLLASELIPVVSTINGLTTLICYCSLK